MRLNSGETPPAVSAGGTPPVIFEVPAAQAGATAPTPNEAESSEPPLYTVHVHEGVPHLYIRVGEEPK